LLFTLAVLLGIKAYNVLLNGRELSKEAVK